MSRRRRRTKAEPGEQWYKVDLHLHTPASADYQEENVKFLDILREAEVGAMSIKALCKKHNLTEQTFFRRRNKFGGLDV